MEIDGRSLPASSVLNADLCIVGGGVAGIMLARQFIGQVAKVLVIESGGRSPTADTQALGEGENAGFPYFPLDEARARCLCGSSFLWHIPIGSRSRGARIRPLDTIDFEARPWVRGSGWPFGLDELAPYYAQACEILHVGPATFDPAYWSDTRLRPCLPLPASELETIIFKFCNREVFVEEFPRELAAAHNVTCCLHSTVLNIETSEAGGEVTSLQVGTLSGNRFRVTAKRFVLAAGGLDTPRLMLLSNRAHPRGIGNGHGHVGRRFMEHLHFWSGILVPESKDAFTRMRLYSGVHDSHGVPVVGKLALPARVLREQRLLNQNVQLIPMLLPDPFRFPRMSGELADAFHALVHASGTQDSLTHFFTVLGNWREVGRVVSKRLRKKFLGMPERPVFILANMAEQTPNDASRVSLAEDVDALGLRKVRLDWRIAPQDIESIRRTHEHIDAVVRKAGLGRLYRELHDDTPPRAIAGRHPQSSTQGGYHHMGTTCMHADPARGVVDASGRVHGLANLYIAGPSVFPTSGYANPVLTIMALTLRLADHLKERLT